MSRPPVHGCRNTRLYEIWHGLRQRCLNKKSKDYPKYGGRGIDVDPRWDYFSVFAADVGEPPSDDHSIDRIDNSRGYWPGNVRWATVQEQANNRRSNVFLEFNGQKLTVAQWARLLGIGVTTLHERLRRGVPLAEALTPIKRKHSSISPRKRKVNRG